MKYLQNRSIRASALQVILSVALLFGFAIVFASLKAAGPSAVDRAQPNVVAQPGFYPALPNGPGPTCTPIEIDDKISTGDPKEMGRITPGGTASTCGNPNPCNVTPGTFHFVEHALTNNTGAERCVTVELSSACAGANAIFAAAYLGSFDPANICTNLIGDTGAVTGGGNLSFGFNVPNGETFVIVVNETTENAGCQAFKLFISGLCESPSPTPTPTPTATATPGKVSQITPTNTTCDQFLNGTAQSLSQVEYSLKGTPAKINQVDPGVFFYWVKFTAQAGSNTVMVNESITSGNFTALHTFQAGSNVFNLDCDSQHPSISQVGGTVSLTFNAPSAGTYVALVKYSANSVKGNLAPTPGTTVHYVIETSGVANSAEDLDMVKKPNSQ